MNGVLKKIFAKVPEGKYRKEKIGNVNPKIKGKDYDSLRKAATEIMGDRFGGRFVGKIIWLSTHGSLLGVYLGNPFLISERARSSSFISLTNNLGAALWMDY